MTDLWGFLLQTLTASGVAAVLLIVKAMFRSKLPPKWQFACWGILVLVMLCPAGLFGRYTLLNWPFLVDCLRSGLFRDYGQTRVLAPIPLLPAAFPATAGQWLFCAYAATAVGIFLWYMLSYIHLRLVLKQGYPSGQARAAQLQRVCQTYHLTPCRTVEISGIHSAFVCGVLHPVLVLPADTEVDHKVLLHELMHLQHRDTAWSFLICLLKSIHWCNPLLLYCAGLAANDLEARCDQRVLELLAGEERRDYGRILLSMSSRRYTQTPGSTCIANGGKNIRRRIEAISRFKLYPAGMGLVSICVLLVLTVALLTGVRSNAVYDPGGNASPALSISSARTTLCTTYAGALDAYGKAVLTQNGAYRMLCTPQVQQEALANQLYQRHAASQFPNWDPGLPAWPNSQAGYWIYNLTPTGALSYEGLLVVRLNYPPNGLSAEEGRMYLAAQRLRVFWEIDRWVVAPLENFRAVDTVQENLSWSCQGLPAFIYSAETGEHRVELRLQTVARMEQSQQIVQNFLLGPVTHYDLTPLPHAEFDYTAYTQSVLYTHSGPQTQQDRITHLGISMQAWDPKLPRPSLSTPALNHVDSVSTGGFSQASMYTRALRPGWGPTLLFDAGGSSGVMDPVLPSQFAADLYIDRERIAELTLTLEGGPQ